MNENRKMIVSEFCHKDIEGWFDFADLYAYVVYAYSEPARFVEIGACFGKSTAFMAEQIRLANKNIEFFVVDIWKSDHQYNKFVRNMMSAGVNSYMKPIRCPSVLAAKQFPDNYFDFIFIDADHSYNEVRNDILAWLPKLKNKPESILAGHDFHMKTVKAAVQDTLGLKKISIWKRSWVYKKCNPQY
jgi:predicted O-methyltransferase YrrM